MIDYWDNSNNKIQKYESYFNKQIGDKVEDFKNNNKNSEEMSKELQERKKKKKKLIDRYDEMSSQLNKVEQEYEKRSKELFDSNKLKHIKNAINNIKKELNFINIQEGLYRGHLMNAQWKEGGDAFEMYNLISNKHSHQDDYDDDSFEI